MGYTMDAKSTGLLSHVGHASGASGSASSISKRLSSMSMAMLPARGLAV